MASPITSTEQETGALQEKLAQAGQERDLLRLEVETLRLHLRYMETRREQGFLAEFDYPYAPKVRAWDEIPGGNVYRRLIATGNERYSARLRTLLAFKDVFAKIPREEPADEGMPFWNNVWFPPLDALCLTALLVSLNPRRYVEVGSGNSTKFARQAISDHRLRTKITSIDPHPRAVIDSRCHLATCGVASNRLDKLRFALYSLILARKIFFSLTTK